MQQGWLPQTGRTLASRSDRRCNIKQVASEHAINFINQNQTEYEAFIKSEQMKKDFTRLKVQRFRTRQRARDKQSQMAWSLDRAQQMKPTDLSIYINPQHKSTKQIKKNEKEQEDFFFGKRYASQMSTLKIESVTKALFSGIASSLSSFTSPEKANPLQGAASAMQKTPNSAISFFLTSPS